MREANEKMRDLKWKIHFKAMELRTKAKETLKKEDGDTNFISIIIILAIVLIVAVVFMSYKDKILKLLSDQWSQFNQAFNGQTKTGPQ